MVEFHQGGCPGGNPESHPGVIPRSEVYGPDAAEQSADNLAGPVRRDAMRANSAEAALPRTGHTFTTGASDGADIPCTKQG